MAPGTEKERVVMGWVQHVSRGPDPFTFAEAFLYVGDFSTVYWQGLCRGCAGTVQGSLCQRWVQPHCGLQ